MPSQPKKSKGGGRGGWVDRPPINLQETLAGYLRGRLKAYHVPQIGTYYPSTLIQACTRGQWNFYKTSVSNGKLPDDFLLHTAEGNVWHEMLEAIGVWDEVEISVKKKVKLADGSYITLSGRADARRGDTVYDFKRTSYVPQWRPRFSHVLQLNFYMEGMGLPKGVLAYVGYYGGKFCVKEFYHTLSDWHTQQLINRAMMLHTALVHNEPPVCTCRSKIHEAEWEHYIRDKANGHKA